MAVVIASTTSTQAEIDHAASDEWRTTPPPERVPEKEELHPQAEPDEELAETDADQEPAEETEEDKQTEKKQGRGSRYKRTIEKLRQSLAESQKENQTLKQQTRQESASAQDAGLPEPKYEDFVKAGKASEYDAARDAWRAAQQERQTILAELKAANGEFAAAMKALTDEGKIGPIEQEFTPGSMSFALDHIRNMGSDGAAVMQALDEHEDLMGDLKSIRNPYKAMDFVSLIRSEIVKSESAEASPTEKPKKQPPPPVRPVGASASSSTVPLDQLSPSEYVRVMNRRDRDRRAGRV